MTEWAMCAGCGELIGRIAKSFHPLEYWWLHCGWQHEYDHLPKPIKDVE